MQPGTSPAFSPVVANSLSIPPYLIGYHVSLIYFAGIFASSIAGSMVKRFGAAMLNQLARFCATVGLLGLATSILSIRIAGSLLIGIAYAFNNPCSSHMAAVQVCGAVGRILWGIVADVTQAGFLVLSALGATTGLCCILLLWRGWMPVGIEVALLCILGACAVGWSGVMLAETARLSS